MYVLDVLKSEIEYLKSNSPNIVGESGLIISDLERLDKSMSLCGTGTVSRRNISTGEKKILMHSICHKSKLCPKCADVEYMKRMKSIDAWYIENRELVSCCYLLTFTQEKRPNESARDSARRVLDSFRSFQRIGQKNRAGEYVKILGGFRSLEIEPTDTGFHSHIHAIVFTSSPLDYRVYKSKVKYQMEKELSKYFGYGKIPSEIYKAEMKKRDGFLHADEMSTISRDWSRAGKGNLSIDVSPIFNEKEKPFKIYNRLQADSKLSKKIRYALKYSMKDGDFSKLEKGRFFELIDAMKGVRKNQYLGGIGKFEDESVEDETEFDYNDHLYEVVKKDTRTDNDVNEKIIREQLVERAAKDNAEKVKLLIELHAKRKEFLLLYRSGDSPAHEYIRNVGGLYERVKTGLKTMKKRLLLESEMIRERMGIKETVWVTN